MVEHRTKRHWRARLQLTFADDPRYDPPTTTRTYSAWIAAGSKKDARTVLEVHVAEIEDLVRWSLTELVEVTEGLAEVIAFWEGL